MSDEVESGLGDRYRKASPWPVFVALGFVLSEVGVVLGFFPVTVGGLLLFGGTVAGILSESGYVDPPWQSLAWFGALLLAIGALTVALYASPGSLSAGVLLDPSNPFLYRGTAIAVAGGMLVTAGAAWVLLDPDAP